MSCKRTINRPIVTEQPVPQYATSKSSALTPFCQRERFATELYSAVSSCVSHLFLASRPAAIFRTIIYIIIYSVNASVRWWLSHVMNKILKRHPSLANSNTTCSVLVITGMMRVVASSFHCTPYAIRSAIRHAMSGLCLNDDFSMEAATAFRRRVTQVSTKYFLDGSTRTATGPVVTSRRSRNDRESVKCFPGDIYECWHT
jgi:hypothetical protein